MNSERAPSWDGLVVHTPNLPSDTTTSFEGSQFKSSGNISVGIPPTEEYLAVGQRNDGPKQKTLWSEWNKISNSTHHTFYTKCLTKQYQVHLFIVSNKPFKDDPTTIPQNVGLICNSNFQDYAGPLAHAGLFHKAEEKEGPKKKESKKEEKKKMEQGMEEQEEDTKPGEEKQVMQAKEKEGSKKEEEKKMEKEGNKQAKNKREISGVILSSSNRK